MIFEVQIINYNSGGIKVLGFCMVDKHRYALISNFKSNFVACIQLQLQMFFLRAFLLIFL